MAITIQYVTSSINKDVVTPAVTAINNVLTVAAATIKLDGVDHALPETTYTSTSRANATSVVIHIVERLSDGVVMYLTDEIIHDGVDLSYDFQGSPYKPLFHLAMFKVPASTTDLTTCAVVLTHTVPPVVEFPPPGTNPFAA